MKNRWFTCFAVVSLLFFVERGGISTSAQDDTTHLRVNVVLVQLNVAVTDSKGEYVTGLKPEDFSIIEDKIPQKISTFEESTAMGRNAVETPHDEAPATNTAVKNADTDPAVAATSVAGVTIQHLTDASVFILFDTSNYMYRSFVFAQDAIADFIRSMDDSARSRSIRTAATCLGRRTSPPTTSASSAVCAARWRATTRRFITVFCLP